MIFIKAFKHFVLITKHRHQVIRNGSHFGIFWHCLKHDLSKYGPTEFWTSVKYFQGTYSPVFAERMDNEYASKIAMHHVRRNKHHWEYWTDFLGGHIIALNMPWVYATEYVCDVLSASKTYDPKNFSPKVAYDYFLDKCDHYFMNEGTKEYIKYLFEELIQNGYKNLKKKNTKEKYKEIISKYPNVQVFNLPIKCRDLPPLNKNKN